MYNITTIRNLPEMAVSIKVESIAHKCGIFCNECPNVVSCNHLDAKRTRVISDIRDMFEELRDKRRSIIINELRVMFNDLKPESKYLYTDDKGSFFNTDLIGWYNTQREKGLVY